MVLKPLPLSVIICTYNRDTSLERCLSSLADQSFTRFEVVVIDGGSTDLTPSVIESFSKKLNIKLVIYESDELSKTRDMGWREANGEITAWIDDDVVVDRNWAKHMIDLFRKHRDVGGITGPTLVPNDILKNRDVFMFYGKTGLLGLMGKFWSWFFLDNDPYAVGRLCKSGAWTPGSNFPYCLEYETIRNVDYLEACNMAIRRELVEKVGGFDLSYRKTAEWCELDIAKRVQELGFKLVFSPKVIVHHHISQAGAFTRRPNARHRMENFIKFYFRHIYRPHVDYMFKFISYVLFLNAYWAYKAVYERNIMWLGGWIGTGTGLINIRKSAKGSL